MIRKVGVGVLVGLAAVLAVTQMASACEPQVTAKLGTQIGDVGTQTVVKGVATQPGEVTIRWNGLHKAEVGRGIADAEGNMTIPVTVPFATPGIYTVYTIDAAGKVERTPFEVTGVGGTAASVEAVTSGGSGNGMAMAGVGLLSAGIVALVIGAGVASSRRRRLAPVAGPPQS